MCNWISSLMASGFMWGLQDSICDVIIGSKEEQKYEKVNVIITEIEKNEKNEKSGENGKDSLFNQIYLKLKWVIFLYWKA